MFPEDGPGSSPFLQPKTDRSLPAISPDKGADEQLKWPATHYTTGSDARAEVFLQTPWERHGPHPANIRNELSLADVQLRATSFGSHLQAVGKLSVTSENTFDQRPEYGDLHRRELAQASQSSFPFHGIYDHSQLHQQTNPLLTDHNFGLQRRFESLPQPDHNNRKNFADESHARYEDACTPRPRWCPTQEQIQLLESLFNAGTTTPSRDMIVDIAAQLRKYGNIAEANVFYWFQNRKARAKRKLQAPISADQEREPTDSESHIKTRRVSLKSCTGSSTSAEAYHHQQQRRSASRTSSPIDPSNQELDKAGLSRSTRQGAEITVTQANLTSPTPWNFGLKTNPCQDTLLGTVRGAEFPYQSGFGTHNFPLPASGGDPCSWSQHHSNSVQRGYERSDAQRSYVQLPSSTSMLISPFGQLQNLQFDPRSCLGALAQRPPPILSYHESTASDQFVQASNKGLLVTDARNLFSENPIVHAKAVDPVVFSPFGNRLARGGAACSPRSEEASCLSQSSLPLALSRTDDGAATGLSAGNLGEGEEELQSLNPWRGNNKV